MGRSSSPLACALQGRRQPSDQPGAREQDGRLTGRDAGVIACARDRDHDRWCETDRDDAGSERAR